MSTLSKKNSCRHTQSTVSRETFVTAIENDSLWIVESLISATATNSVLASASRPGHLFADIRDGNIILSTPADDDSEGAEADGEPEDGLRRGLSKFGEDGLRNLPKIRTLHQRCRQHALQMITRS
jgi:hypothetical protein